MFVSLIQIAGKYWYHGDLQCTGEHPFYVPHFGMDLLGNGGWGKSDSLTSLLNLPGTLR